MDDALRLLGLEQLVRVSANIEAQLVSEDHTPLLAVLARAREDAAEAMVRLTQIDPHNPAAVRDLQNKATRYESLIVWLREIVADGREADIEVSAARDERAEEMRDLVLGMDDDTRIALGIKEPGAGTE